MLTLLILLFTITLPLSSSAQDDSALQPGAWALQFQVTENFTLSDLQGSVVSVKYHSSAKSAWRAGVSMDFDSMNDTRRNTDAGVPDPDLTTEFTRTAAELALQYVRYANPDARVMFLFGGGPFFGFEDRARDSDSGGGSMNHEEFDRWSVGISGIVGVEWLVASRIGIHAEYGLAYRYFDQRSKVANEAREQVVEGDGHDFGGRPVLLGVSAYF